MFSNKDLTELSNSFRAFDFEGAIMDIIRWQQELGEGVEDSITFNTLEGVLDIILDRSTF